MLVVLALLVAGGAGGGADGAGRPDISKNADLLEVIKLNLRKNNEDYSDVSLPTRPSAAPASSSAPHNNNTRDVIHIKGVRRANDDILMDSDMMDNILDFGYTPKINNSNLGSRKNGIINRLKGKQIKPIERNFIQRSPASVKAPGALTTKRKAVSKSHDQKLEKVRKFYEKNKHLLKEFLSSKIAARTATAATGTPATSATPATPATAARATNKMNLRQALRPNKVRQRGKGVLSRGQDWLGEDDNSTEPPNPDLLDMMPAVGGRIHFRRLEGRLCHRHVIIPEGPKYDSAGRVYLAPHADVVRRPYHVTRRPSLLLPKCCNCCKKSVLGCE